MKYKIGSTVKLKVIKTNCGNFEIPRTYYTEKVDRYLNDPLNPKIKHGQIEIDISRPCIVTYYCVYNNMPLYLISYIDIRNKKEVRLWFKEEDVENADVENADVDMGVGVVNTKFKIGSDIVLKLSKSIGGSWYAPYNYNGDDIDKHNVIYNPLCLKTIHGDVQVNTNYPCKLEDYTNYKGELYCLVSYMGARDNKIARLWFKEANILGYASRITFNNKTNQNVNKSKQGAAIEVQAVNSSISTGDRRRGVVLSGRIRQATIGSRHLIHKPCAV